MSTSSSPAIFVGDLHIDFCQEQRMLFFLQFLQSMQKQGYQIYIMGDLFNFWAGRQQQRVREVKKFLQGLAALLADQQNIFFLPGNRDFLFTPLFANMQGKVIYDGTLLELGGERVLLFHGDALCANDIQYQRMKKILQSRAIFQLSNFLPTSYCIKVGQKFREASKKAHKQKNCQPVTLSDPYMLQLLREQQADHLICGHIHLPQIRKLQEQEKTYRIYVIPECRDLNISFLVWDKGRFSYQSYQSLLANNKGVTRK